MRKREAEAAKVISERHNQIPYALEAVPRPGAHEIRVRPAPDGMRIRNRGEKRHGQ